jgi:hypothetical protein
MRTLDSLDPHARGLVTGSLDWMAPHWDEAAGLLWMITKEPHPTNVPPGTRVHVTRDSLWYAVGLFLRNGPGDQDRGRQIVGATLETQLDAPGTVFHGTFKRSPEEPVPPQDAVVWKHFDPNWREFIGTMYAILLDDFPEVLPDELVRRMESALRLAVEGAIQRNVPASYTNIALMSAFLQRYVGDRLDVPEWRESGEQLAKAVHAIYAVDETFPEYNSPTYYGVNLFAFALWRSYSRSPEITRMGEEMEAGLWRDVARFYHAGLRNLCGPYDRSYGMDMMRYAAITGLWVWAAVGEEQAPFPDWRREFGHTNDFCIAPTVAHLGARVPDEVRTHLLAFQGERRVERVIATDPRRVATAWLGDRLMVGAEDASGTKRPGYQYHPATAHWRLPGGGTGWLRLTHTIPVDAKASGEGNGGQIEVWASPQAEGAAADGELVIEVSAEGAASEMVGGSEWQLPGLRVLVETEASEPEVSESDGLLRVRYAARAGEARLTLRLETVEAAE